MTDNTPPVALEPCPFCWHDASIDGTRHGYPPSHWVKCSNCGASTTEYSHKLSAITAWNTRTPSHSDLVEALRAAREFIKHRGGPLCSARYYNDAHCDCGATEAIAKIDAILTKAEAPHG